MRGTRCEKCLMRLSMRGVFCLIDKILWCHDKVRWNIRPKYVYESASLRSKLFNVRTGCEISGLEMVKSLDFAGLKFTFHRFDSLDKVCKSQVKTWWRWSGNEKRIIRLCHLQTMSLRIQWIQQYRWHILETIRDQGQSLVVRRNLYSRHVKNYHWFSLIGSYHSGKMTRDQVRIRLFLTVSIYRWFQNG